MSYPSEVACNRCTCGPPRAVYLDFSSCDEHVCSDVQEACRSHGYFYAIVPAPNFRLSAVLPRAEALFDDGNACGENCTKFEAISGATYRGRGAESGSTGEEPKQSWEYACTENYDDEDCHKIGEIDDKNILSQWAEGLHKVAIAAASAMKIPDAFLSGRKHDQTKNSRGCRPNLLRVFRYDALADERQRQTRLGSSAHTDWGCLTVVWQDQSGGLQTWCHRCEKWTDIPAEATDDKENNGLVRFIVHVGDFGSLASGGQWPTPRHRVLNPLSRGAQQNNPRYSLVYFAYPRPGLSLAEAEQAISKIHKLNTPHKSIPNYQHYSLLQNQAPDAFDDHCSAAAERTYHSIRHRPFDEVIFDKWSQVQRNY